MPLPFPLTKLLIRTGLARFLPAARRLTDGDPGVLAYYSDKVLTAPVEELLDPATFPQVPGPDVLNLNDAAPRFDSPVSAGRVAADRSGSPSMWGLPALRDAIAESYHRRDGRDVDPDSEVLITRGATGAFAAVLDAFINPGDRVALFDPCSPMFSLGVKSRRAKTLWVPMASSDNRSSFDFDTLAWAMRGAKLLAISNPGNPTGATLSPDDCDRIAWLADRYDVLVYLDETFSRFRYDGRPCGLAKLPGMARRTLSAGSVTTDGLGSVRVGWLTGPKSLVRACALTSSLAGPYVPTVCQQVALRSVQADEELFGPVLEEFRSRRRYAFDRLKAMGLNPSWPAGGFFFWVPVTQFNLDGRAFAERLLKEQRVLVGPGCAYGPSGASHVRISFTADDGRMRAGLGRLATFVAGLRGEPAAPVKVPEPEKVDEERAPAFSRV